MRKLLVLAPFIPLIAILIFVAMYWKDAQDNAEAVASLCATPEDSPIEIVLSRARELGFNFVDERIDAISTNDVSITCDQRELRYEEIGLNAKRWRDGIPQNLFLSTLCLHIQF